MIAMTYNSSTTYDMLCAIAIPGVTMTNYTSGGIWAVGVSSNSGARATMGGASSATKGIYFSSGSSSNEISGYFAKNGQKIAWIAFGT